MLPNPLHPAIVHFPIVFVSVAPLVAAAALWAIRAGARPVRAWGVAVALLAALFVSSWAAVRTGEQQEDAVEEVVSGRVIHEHEEAAERFLVVAGAVFVVGLVGLAGGRFGASARVVAALGTVVALATGVGVGHSGGDLVYRHGAANAYVQAASPADGGSARGEAPDQAGDRSEDRDGEPDDE